MQRAVPTQPYGTTPHSSSHFHGVEVADGPDSNDCLDLGDSLWEPKGLEGFICETRARRSKIASSDSTFTRRVLPSPSRTRAALSRAPQLFRKVDCHDAMVAALDQTPKSVASESDQDEMAPIAFIPTSLSLEGS